MSSTAMTSILVAALAAFAWSALRRWNLLRVGTGRSIASTASPSA